MRAFRPLYLIVAVLSVTLLPPSGAEADIAHRLHFKADARIIVWGESKQHQIAPENSRNSLKLPQTAHQLHTPIVQTGRLVPTHIATPLENRPSSQARFNVASNTGFAIKAELTRHTQREGQLQHLPFVFKLQKLGAKAIAPASGETGQATRLSDLIHPVIVYESPIATAARPGSIADQSVAFGARWGQPAQGGPIDITFTVFRP